MVDSCPHSLYFYRGDVEDFDFENATNTFKDWHIMPLSRPVISPPTQKRMMIDIPGSQGVLDLSNSLTKYPVFENRTGSMTFAVDYDKTDWITAYTKIMKFLQGNPVKVIMEDDPKYFYEGSVWVDEWNSRNDGTWSEITLSYDFQPYRRSIYSSIDDWLWDPFNFETDFIQSTVFNAIQVNSVDWVERDFTGLIDMMPIIPEFTVSVEEGDGISAGVYNSDIYGTTWKDFVLPGGTSVNYDCILSEATPESIIKMRFKGNGVVTIKFRSGRL